MMVGEAESNGIFFLTDGGIETALIFLEGFELAFFVALHLPQIKHGEAALMKYFLTYANLVQKHRCGLVSETPTC
jgi:hypothetical protein